MYELGFLIIWLVSVLPTSASARLDAEKIHVMAYAKEKAIEQNVDAEKFALLIHCESRIDKKQTGDRGESKGLLQFKKATFQEFSKLYKLKGEWLDSYDQIDLATKMISDGLWYKWYVCSRLVGLNLDYKNKDMVLKVTY